MKILSRANAKKKWKGLNLKDLKFHTLLVVFKCHHGSEWVKLHLLDFCHFNFNCAVSVHMFLFFNNSCQNIQLSAQSVYLQSVRTES